MRLVVFNGSPRGKASNSEVIIQWLTSDLEGNTSINIDISHLAKLSEHDECVRKLKEADMAVIVFPLYTDSMPGLVMAYLEKLAPLRKSLSSLKLGFVVHSGFPEACQSRAVESYLVWLANELGTQYAGTVIMGGSEGVRFMSANAAQNKKSLFAALGRSLVEEGRFSPELIKKAAGMERLPTAVALLLKVMSRFSSFQSMWDSQLKKNNAYEQRSARPYEV